MAKDIFDNLLVPEESPLLDRGAAARGVINLSTIKMDNKVVFEKKTERVEKTPNVKSNLQSNMKSRLLGMEANTGHHDSHCDIRHQGNGKYIEEKNIPISSSIKDAKNVEGCQEHYFSRFVKIDEAPEKSQGILTKRQAAEAIVWGEILNDPPFKRRWR